MNHPRDVGVKEQKTYASVIWRARVGMDQAKQQASKAKQTINKTGDGRSLVACDGDWVFPDRNKNRTVRQGK